MGTKLLLSNYNSPQTFGLLEGLTFYKTQESLLNPPKLINTPVERFHDFLSQIQQHKRNIMFMGNMLLRETRG
ncbi:hypothetical protein XELAEV_18037122mg [Xenopus laevis]|uniref:Uncharacterized protein n=1 Tax=Xenopus laevis TaxID=8355 RepID=A0A974HAC9_XENLA|nr:hypothetical protein XELAEV_18037122mg [Xenopus laevis]